MRGCYNKMNGMPYKIRCQFKQLKMPKFKNQIVKIALSQIICCLFLLVIVQSPCPFPYERCLCTGGTPYCPCSLLTSTQTLNTAPSPYYSHLVSVSGNGCRACAPRCKKCSSLQTCTECFDEFELINNVCAPCPINCKKCKIGVCQDCIDGYYIDYQKKCQKCPLEGTKTCTVDSLRSCQANYWLDNNGAQCVNCDANCKNCSSTTKCSKCLDGFYESEFTCVACKDECRTCSNGASCVDCKQAGFYYDSTKKTCTQCEIANCLTCSSNATCLLCDSSANSFLDKTSKLCIKPSPTLSTQNCKNLTSTSSILTCESCNDGFYTLNDYTNASQLMCYFGCSVVCSKCSGPNYGLCDECVSSTDFDLVNRNCIPHFNVNDGAGFQMFYTAFNNGSYFQTAKLISPDSCWHQYVRGESSQIVVRLSQLGVYKVKLRWKIYKYNFISNATSATQTYDVQLNNSIVNKTLTSTFTAQVCQKRIGFSSLCTDGFILQCVDKGQIQFQGVISSQQNKITFLSQNSMLAISQLLIIGYRCGGIYGEGCIECSDINTCTECLDPDFYLIEEKCIVECPNSHYTFQSQKRCVEICPVKSYADDALHQCFSCQSPCETCISATQCLTCREGFFFNSLTGKCQSQCPKRFYRDSYRRICEQCVHPCLECLDSLKCVNCREGFLSVLNSTLAIDGALYGNCVLQCPDNQFADLQTMKCQTCSSPCQTCSGLNISCTSCINSYLLHESQCLLSCPIGFYADVNSTCAKCIDSCKDCKNMAHCTQCSLGYYLDVSGSCVSNCTLGYYAEQILKKCQPCHQNCKTCKSETVCSSCLLGFSYFEQNYSCLSQCPKFYYKSAIDSQSSVCIRCQLPCYDCSSETVCLSCYDSFLYQGECLLVCPKGYFANVNTLKCELCDQDFCQQCKNTAQQCTKCNATLLLVNEKCLKQCPSGFYFSSYKQECLLCEGLCNTCLNMTYCLSCIEGFMLNAQTGLCVNSCDQGYYQQVDEVFGTFTCNQCPSNCESCFFNLTQNKVTCLSCNQGYFFNSGECQSSCGDGFYSVGGYCLTCSLPCSKCIDQETCIECQPNYGMLYQGSCISECPYGYYASNNRCLKCSDNCLLCSQNDSYCTACSNSWSLLVRFLTDGSLSSTCVSKCPSGYLQLGKNNSYEFSCQLCSDNCKECENQFDECTACKGVDQVLFQNKCIKICPIDHYLDSMAKQCIPCPVGCQFCLNSTFCLKCSQNYFMNDQDVCSTKCSSNQYGQDGICKKCAFPCKSCTGESSCLSCIQGIYYQTQCIDQCPEGSYYSSINGIQQCLDCSENCSRCSAKDQCSYCSFGYLFQGKCYENCPEGYYQSYGVCIKCQQNCKTCSNSYFCSSCVTDTFLFQSRCLVNCPVGYVSVSSQSNSNVAVAYCEACQSGCTKCYKSASRCTECSKGFYLYIDKCVSICPSGTYRDDKLLICQPCISPCETCQNAYSCDTCVYGYLLYRESSRNQCVEGPKCPNNYFLNADESICEFECSESYFVESKGKTCSKLCPSGFVTYATNKSCLQTCPQNMWVDEKRYCEFNESEAYPNNLPCLNCQSFVVRNLLFFKCFINVPIQNLGTLAVNDFKLSEGVVTLLKIKNNKQFYLLVLSLSRRIKAQSMTVQLVNKYKLVAFPSDSSTAYNSSARLLEGDIIGYDLSEGVNQSLKSSDETDSIDQRPNSPHTIVASSTVGYPVQNNILRVFVQDYVPYVSDQREVGMSFYSIGQSISYGALVLWFFSLIKNLKPTSLLFITNLQWLFCLSIVSSNLNLAPNFSQFLEGFKFSTLLNMGPGLSLSGEKQLWLVPQVQRNCFWAIDDYYSLPSSLMMICILGGVFVVIYLIVLMGEKIGQKRQFEYEQQQEQQNEQEKQQSKQQETQKSFKQSLKSFKKSTENEEKQKQSPQPEQNENPKKPSEQALKNDSEQQQQAKPEQKQLPFSIRAGKKCHIIRQRFQFNYTYHFMFISAQGLSLSTHIALVRPTLSSLIESIAFILLYTVFVIVCLYNYWLSKRDRRKYKDKKPLRSTAFFFINFLEIMVQNVLIVWSSFYFVVGFSIVVIVLNIVAWNWVYKKAEPDRCSYLQMLEITKGLVLVILIIGDIKQEKWTAEQNFLYGFVQVGIVFLLIILSSISIATELFADQAFGRTSSYKALTRVENSQQGNSKKSLRDDEQEKESSGFEDDEEFSEEESFFSNKTPVDNSDQDDSDSGSIIDFDESQQSSQSHRPNQAPQQLYKYAKDQS